MSFESLLTTLLGTEKNNRKSAIDYGEPKKKGGHDHRYNKGEDRTPAQREGDKKRRKSDE